MTNSLSYQVAIPTSNANKAYVRYQDVRGEYMNGQYASVGMQTMDAKYLIPHIYYEEDTIYSGKCTTFNFGTNSEPTKVDTDNDGLTDAQENAYHTNPNRRDSDGDGIPDKWEIEHNLNPRDSTDGEQNLAAFQNLNAVQASENTRELEFNINGDYAAWMLEIEGLNEKDRNVRYITMGAPDSATNVIVNLVKGGRYKLSMQWLNCDGHDDLRSPWYCWQAKIDGLPNQQTYSNYSNIRKEGAANVVCGNGWLVDNSSGLLTKHVDQNTSDGAGNVAEGLESILYVLEDPILLPDYNRDGVVDDNDSTNKNQNVKFRFWVNDDEDRLATEGKYSESPRVNIPGAATGLWEFDRRDPDFSTGSVDGICDLLDFTPFFVNVSRVVDCVPEEMRDKLSFRLKHDDEAVNVVWSNLNATNAVSFLRTDLFTGFGPSLNLPPQSAQTVSVSRDGCAFPSAFAERAKSNGAVFLIEGCKTSSKPLWVEVLIGEEVICSNKVEMSISSVESMYRKYSLRDAVYNPAMTIVPSTENPANQPDSTKNLDVFFLHGFNVSEQDASAWGAEVFKRLWQSGSNAKFHILPWHGDYSWSYGSLFNGLHYQHNVWYAQRTGNALKRYIETIQPDSSKRILMTQSLGNMVACEALREGLQVNQYYMFDAAIPSEAIDDSLRAETPTDEAFSKYVRPEWHGYTNQCWAANWSCLFASEPNDTRKQMSWTNRFANALGNATEVFNYYSSGDSVFAETDTVPPLFEDVFHNLGINWFLWLIPYPTVDVTFDNHCWQKQEVLKGMSTIAGTLSGGWGFNIWDEYDDQAHEWKSVCYSPAGAAAAVQDHSIINRPAFDVSDAAEMMNPNATEDDVFLALAKHVPALSSPVGGSPVLGRDRDFDLNLGDYRNNWGRSADSYYELNWLHSDMKDMAYFYIYKLYDELVQKGGLKCENY